MNAKSTTTTNQTSEPWKVQQPYLTDAFEKAKAASGSSYTGDRVAQFDPSQLSTFQNMLNYSGMSTAPTTEAGTTLTGAGVGATTGALSSLGAFNPTGGTQSNIDAANAYADAAASPEAVDAAMRDANRQVYEQGIPQIARTAAGTGNTFSSKRGASEAILQRGLADRTADVSAQMRSDAFGTGLNLAEQGRQFDNSATLDAIRAQLAGGTSAVGAGVGASTAGVANQGALFDMANQAGSGLTAAEQAKLDNNVSKSNSVWDDLMKYYSVVGGNNWGGTSSGTQESSPSMWNVIGGLLGAGGSLLKSDREAKRDIERIGQLDNGLPIYRYRYKDHAEGPVFIGLMAQDVEVQRPEAVRVFNGVKHVNYDLATRPLDDNGGYELKWSR